MSIVGENPELFEGRKADHIRLALDPRTQAVGLSGLSNVHLTHEAFPEINFNDVSIATTVFGRKIASPLFVSSMTAGHTGSVNLNMILARVSEKRDWAMGVGSQRRQLTDHSVDEEWTKIRKACPRVRFFGNIGVAQLVVTKTSDIKRLAETLGAEAMFVHTNPLQECMQPEGTPQFAGGLKAIERLVNELDLPVIVKETGCGFSKATLERLKSTGVAAVDVSGLGGTHWGRIEGGRSKEGGKLQKAAETFADWGISTVDSMIAAQEVKPSYAVWASGGVRTGLDAAKLFALGAQMVGLAQPLIEAALKSEEELDALMKRLEFELKTALFCTGSQTLNELREKKVWHLVR